MNPLAPLVDDHRSDAALPIRRVWRRFRAHRLGLAGAVMLTTLALLAILAPWIAPYPPAAIDLHAVAAPPSWAHPLGTDELGRDVLTRVLYGGRVSLPVGISSTMIAVVIGTAYGCVAGLRRGPLDSLMMRGVDLLLSLPTVFVLLILTTYRRASVLALVLYIGVFGWPGIARLIRGQVLSLRERDFIVAVVAEGADTRRIVLQHLVPNAAAPVIVAATLGVGGAMLVEAALDFLGFGVPPDIPTWGNMLTNAELTLVTQPLLALVPGLLITFAVLSFGFIGDALRDALDPYTVTAR